MELFVSDNHFILQNENGEHSLWIERLKGTCESKKGSSLEDAECLGTVYGYLGKLRVSQTSDTRLVFIRQRSLVGTFKDNPIYKIPSVVLIPLEGDTEVLIESSSGVDRETNDTLPPGATSASSAPSSTPGSPSHQNTEENSRIKSLIKVRVPPLNGLISKKIDSKVDRSMLDEFSKMFTEADSFYYSPTFDITNSVQRRHETLTQKSLESALWQMADNRFFWNFWMLRNLVNSKDKSLDCWIMPIIQGFIQCESCTIEHAIDPIGHPESESITATIELWLISRRSRFQAGTRYLRRGINENGKVANYVETETVVVYKGHLFSFVQVRGSVPVFWSQSNSYRYRPPPKIEKDEVETYNAFKKHFDEELSIYQKIVIITLIEKAGKEKVLGDTFIRNVLQLNSSEITYITFDFHEQCRGMRFDNVSILTNKLYDNIRKIGYCWIDSYGLVLKQEGTYRVNCVDCLDRTNVVQTHLAKEMLTYELSKVGLIAPEIGLPLQVKRVLQILWANNGDTISKQYAGTNALKGDFTRTGERKLAGVMKDGMNSANRYYLNRFKDTSRQAAIDLMLGVRKTVTEADLTDDKLPFEKENSVEQVKAVIEDVKRCIIPADEVSLGAWGLINGKLNEPDTIDIDSIVVLTESNYYVTEYDCSMDSMTQTQKVTLISIEYIELGFDKLTQPAKFWNILAGNSNNQTLVPNIKINFRQDGKSCVHEFRSSNMRFFNNVAIPIQQPEEMHESLKMISETIRIAVAAQGKNIQVRVQRDSSNKGRLPGRASNFVNRYFNPVQQMDSTIPIAKKISTAPFDRLKYFRRGSGTAENGELVTDEQDGTLDSPQNSSAISTREEHLPRKLHLKTDSKSKYPDLSAMTPDPTQRSSMFVLENDLVLSSCGILSPGRRNIGQVLVRQELMMNPGDESDLGISPLTPISDSHELTPSPNLFPKINIPTINSLHHHRYSLPTNSFSVGIVGESPKRSRTPEITITEEIYSNNPSENFPQTAENDKIALSVATRRISRSTEDVNKMHGSGFAIPIIGSNSRGSGFKLTNLFSTKSDNRASSQQNISDSARLKGSHSDNALRENQQSPQTQKRDMVLAPLGKLAKGMQNLGASYLDPRKLRESFKPVVKQDSIEDKELEERKLQSKTGFIDI